jgi:tRNA modification GTPase
MFLGDTIAAISTPPGRGGIGVVRLSGPDALKISRRIFKSESPIGAPNQAHYGRVVDPDSGEHVDEAICTYFKAPHSYTGEDVIELSCHGSPVVLGYVLDLLVSRGIRIAEPGEFTFRAFFHKRIDLAQAQAVRDVINAQTAYQVRVANRQLEGALSRTLSPLKQSLIDIIVHLESSVEFVEEDISIETASALYRKLDLIINGLNGVAAGYSFGRFVREGFDLAIVGRPNVGKSSVFNRLVGADRAIVTDLPGTTRDTLSEATSIAGVPVRLIDTAGIRETVDLVEGLGITRSKAAIADADISLVVLDASEPLTQDDLQLLAIVPEERRIVGLNKTDLIRRLESNEPAANGESCVEISALTGSGFETLTQMIFAKLSGEDAIEREDVLLTDARQHHAIRTTVKQLDEARDLMIRKELEEIVLLKLQAGLQSLGEVTGETLTDDILAQIFSTFCIGK